MKNLYEVTLERTTYNGEKSIETCQLFAESPKKINTYRLGGFQRDTVKVIKTKKIRARRTVELDVDIKRNDITASISVDDHLNATLNLNKNLTKLLKNDDDIEELLESLGYHIRASNNTYNYSSDFENELDFHIFTKSKKSDYLNDNTAIVVVYEHSGLDVRAGYKFKGVYDSLDHDGLFNFLEMHVSIHVLDSNNESVDQYDGDGAFESMLEEYKIKSYNEKTQDLIITKNGQDFTASWYHPAMD